MHRLVIVGVAAIILGELNSFGSSEEKSFHNRIYLRRELSEATVGNMSADDALRRHLVDLHDIWERRVSFTSNPLTLRQNNNAHQNEYQRRLALDWRERKRLRLEREAMEASRGQGQARGALSGGGHGSGAGHGSGVSSGSEGPRHISLAGLPPDAVTMRANPNGPTVLLLPAPPREQHGGGGGRHRRHREGGGQAPATAPVAGGEERAWRGPSGIDLAERLERLRPITALPPPVVVHGAASPPLPPSLTGRGPGAAAASAAAPLLSRGGHSEPRSAPVEDTPMRAVRVDFASGSATGSAAAHSEVPRASVARAGRSAEGAPDVPLELLLAAQGPTTAYREANEPAPASSLPPIATSFRGGATRGGNAALSVGSLPGVAMQPPPPPLFPRTGGKRGAGAAARAATAAPAGGWRVAVVYHGHYDRSGSRLAEDRAGSCSDFFLNAANHDAALFLPIENALNASVDVFFHTFRQVPGGVFLG